MTNNNIFDNIREAWAGREPREVELRPMNELPDHVPSVCVKVGRNREKYSKYHNVKKLRQ